MTTIQDWICTLFHAADVPTICATDRWATKDADVIADYLIASSIHPSFNDRACADLPIVPLAEPLTNDQRVRRFAEIPADYLSSDQRTACPYLGDAPFNAAETDQRHFWNLLVAIIPEAIARRTTVEPVPSEHHRILDIACGSLAAASALQSYFGGAAYGDPAPEAHYIGIDISENAIAAARGANRGLPNVDFEVADATDIAAQPWAKNSFDTVVIRHPEVFRRYEKGLAATWYPIFKTAAAQLQTGGLLLVTTHRCFEFQGADAALTQLGLTRLYAAQHPCAPDIHAPDY
ncbi:MAG: methyltransferase domain-containing protein [Deltaproteobacteria bacterium]|nr:methyltransferase domain-containing protein [Deltaproteobacteria bacterium]